MGTKASPPHCLYKLATKVNEGRQVDVLVVTQEYITMLYELNFSIKPAPMVIQFRLANTFLYARTLLV